MKLMSRMEFDVVSFDKMHFLLLLMLSHDLVLATQTGIGDSSAPTDTPLNDADNGTGTFNDGAPKKEDGAPANMTAIVDKAGTVSVDAKEGAGDAHISENSMLESKEEVASNHPGVNEGVDNELDRELKRARVEEV
mmetsp:Transcript_20024/g.41987  ORF Transcript_20024/g.41987 Transcript_20024/m.41987 type:complete len:136 (-) Transcript_20024:121-528(-)